jgi:hypothetical protein
MLQIVRRVTLCPCGRRTDRGASPEVGLAFSELVVTQKAP